MNEVQTELQKLQSLCDKVNRRYKSGLNDDDQVSAMFKYAAKCKHVSVIVGYDEYHAMTDEQIEKMPKIKVDELDKFMYKGWKFHKANITKTIAA